MMVLKTQDQQIRERKAKLQQVASIMNKLIYSILYFLFRWLMEALALLLFYNHQIYTNLTPKNEMESKRI